MELVRSSEVVWSGLESASYVVNKRLSLESTNKAQNLMSPFHTMHSTGCNLLRENVVRIEN